MEAKIAIKKVGKLTVGFCRRRWWQTIFGFAITLAVVPIAWPYVVTFDQHAARTVALRLPAMPETVETALRGVPLSDSLVEYQFDARNRLRRVTDKDIGPGSRLQTVYDYYPDGRRARKIVSNWTNSTWQVTATHAFLYDGWNLVQEHIHTPTPPHSQTRLYTWGLDLAGLESGEWGQDSGGIGSLLAITEITGVATNVFLPIADQVGTVHALVAAMTNSVAVAEPFLAARYTYSPYGELLEREGAYALSCPIGFQSKYRDEETDLVYFGYRYYAPRAGKWLTHEPIAEAGGFNLTAFCGNDPLNQVDPLGLEISQTEFCGFFPSGYVPYLQSDASLFSLDAWEHIAVGAANIGNLVANTVYGGLDVVGMAGEAVDDVSYFTTGMNSAELYMNVQAIGPLGGIPYALKSTGTGMRTVVARLTRGVSSPAVGVNRHNFATRVIGTARSSHSVSGQVGGRIPAHSRLLPAGDGLPNAGGRIRSFVTQQDETYYRVFSGDSTRGRYLVRTRPVSGQFAQEALSLPPGNTADFVQEVLVPAGSRLQRSRALPVPEWGRFRGGGEQFQ